MSSTLLRSVSSPRPSTMAFLASGLTRDSAVAWNRVPISAPAAPSASAAATPRPSAMSPGGQHRDRRRQVHHDRRQRQRGPAPPGAVPARLGALGDDHVRAFVHRLPRLLHVRDLNDQPDAGLADEPGERPGVAEGQHHRRRLVLQRGRQRAGIDRPALEADAPRPWVVSATSVSSRESQSRSPEPPPSRPSPPPFDTAAASAPPADPPIGASAIGCRMPNISVNAVDNVMVSIVAAVPGSVQHDHGQVRVAAWVRIALGLLRVVSRRGHSFHRWCRVADLPPGLEVADSLVDAPPRCPERRVRAIHLRRTVRRSSAQIVYSGALFRRQRLGIKSHRHPAAPNTSRPRIAWPFTWRPADHGERLAKHPAAGPPADEEPGRQLTPPAQSPACRPPLLLNRRRLAQGLAVRLRASVTPDNVRHPAGSPLSRRLFS